MRRFGTILLALCVCVAQPYAADTGDTGDTGDAAADAAPAESAGSSMGTGGSSAAVSVRSPYSSLERTREIMRMLAVELSLERGYRSEEGVSARTDIAGVEAVISLERYETDAISRIDIAAAKHPAGGWQIYVTGRRRGPGGSEGNGDIARAGRRLYEVTEEIRQSRLAPDAESIATEVYQLSYVRGDRAVALLRALGYSVIDFSAVESGLKNEFTFLPDGTLEVLAGDETSRPVRLPAIIRLLNADDTSLLDPDLLPPPPPGSIPGLMSSGSKSNSVVPDIGGTYLHPVTTAEPQERLMIAYDRNEPERARRLFDLLNDQIDVPSRQIVIEALVVEVDKDKLRDIGVELQQVGGDLAATFGSPASQFFAPLVYDFDRDGMGGASFLRATLTALAERGEASILSNPSVLVLDGRQARIQIGQQIPVVTSSTNLGVVTGGVNYFPVGIVLNLRPRINADATQISMQVETIVSAVSQSGGVETSSEEGVSIIAPVVDNRQVQTFVRVNNNTPFIIGGLISSAERIRVTGIPGLMRIPGLGALFRRKKKELVEREVIVVLTPHVVPRDSSNYNYLIPRPSPLIDKMGHVLFQNAYRLTDSDVFELSFIKNGELLERARAEANEIAANIAPGDELDPVVKTLTDGDIPGEEILVRRMLWEIVDKQQFGRFINPERIIFFKGGDGEGAEPFYSASFLHRHLEKRGSQENALILSFRATGEVTLDQPFARPIPLVSLEKVIASDYPARLSEGNRRSPKGEVLSSAIILGTLPEDVPGRLAPEKLLRDVLVLHRILKLNPDLKLTLREFYAGRQIVFPTEEELRNSYHVINPEIAKLFFETLTYYKAFEEDFKAAVRRLRALEGAAVSETSGLFELSEPAAAAAAPKAP